MPFFIIPCTLRYHDQAKMKLTRNLNSRGEKMCCDYYNQWQFKLTVTRKFQITTSLINGVVSYVGPEYRSLIDNLGVIFCCDDKVKWCFHFMMPIYIGMRRKICWGVIYLNLFASPLCIRLVYRKKQMKCNIYYFINEK